MKKSAIAIFCACAASTMSAHVLTPAEALGRAAGARVAALKPDAATMPDPSFTVSCSDGLPALYIFANGEAGGDGGFLMLSADSEATPVVGYADSGTFQPDRIPDNMKAWLEFYAAEIKASRTVSAPALRDIERPQRQPIAPIVTSQWNQNAPYNLLCPDGSATGCVATAMAQVMRVMEYPDKCSGGTFSYTAKNLNRTISLNFDNISLDWDSMTDSYGAESTDTEKQAIATLMYAIGVSAQMNYGPSSGTSATSLAEGLIRNFGFSRSLTNDRRDWHKLIDWEEIIYAELEKGMPVYYDGGNDTSAHAFVVDGYSDDGFFHLNWGWGGMSDGYFRLSALDPESQGIGGSAAGYNFYQSILTGLAPKGTASQEEALKHNLVFSSNSPIGISTTSTYLGENVTITGGSFNASAMDAENVTLTVKFTSVSDGSVTYASQGLSYPQLPPNTGFNEYTVRLPALEAGEYIVSRAVINKYGKPFDLHSPIGIGSLHATVTNTRITFTSTGSPELEITMDSAPDEVYSGKLFTMEFSITNNDTDYHHGGVRICLSKSGLQAHTPVASLGLFQLDLDPDETTVIDAICAVPSDITPGEYRLTATNEDYSAVYASQPVTVSDAGTTTMAFGTLRCTDPARDGLKFRFSATCTEGYFSERIYLYLFDPDMNPGTVASTVSAPLFISRGETVTVDMGLSYPQGTVGKRYVAAIYRLVNGALEQATSAIYVTLGKSGLETVITPGQDAAGRTFDVLGRPVADPFRPGLHISPAGKTLRLR
ncbi:MAG: C10 family peptidase [Muribaculaceae bacterium]|nr:C10 family peptidase [Muribaculaceae bacterium]